MHIAATNPLSLSEATLDPAVVERELAVQTAQGAGRKRDLGQAEARGGDPQQHHPGPDEEVPRRESRCWARHSCINPDLTVAQAAKEAGVEITGFARVMVGEGIEKEKEDFAAEVAKMAGLRPSCRIGHGNGAVPWAAPFLVAVDAASPLALSDLRRANRQMQGAGGLAWHSYDVVVIGGAVMGCLGRLLADADAARPVGAGGGAGPELCAGRRPRCRSPRSGSSSPPR